MKHYPRILLLIRNIEQCRDWDRARRAQDTKFYLMRAAIKLGFCEPYTDEQKALNDYLFARQADIRLCDYAWRVYAQSL